MTEKIISSPPVSWCENLPANLADIAKWMTAHPGEWMYLGGYLADDVPRLTNWFVDNFGGEWALSSHQLKDDPRKCYFFGRYVRATPKTLKTPNQLENKETKMLENFSHSNILEAADASCENRDGIYGDAAETFQKTAQAWQLILDHPVTREQVALCMAALKIVRAAHTPTHMDSWIDLAGYAALGGQLASTSKPSVKRGLTERTNTHAN